MEPAPERRLGSSARTRHRSWPGSSTAAGSPSSARVDGRYLSTEVAGGMTGRMLGVALHATAPSLVRSFEYVGADDPAALS